MYRGQQMPVIDLEALRPDLEPMEVAIVRRIIASQGKNKGRLRASKPHVDNDADPLSGKAAYVWRMVAFMASPDPRHSCMPVTADWDLPVPYGQERRAMTKELDQLVDKVVATMPMSEGAMSWARGFGLVR